MSYHCEHCGGYGKIIDLTYQVVEKFDCPHCNGSGRMRFDIYNYNLNCLKNNKINKTSKILLNDTCNFIRKIEVDFIVNAIVEFSGEIKFSESEDGDFARVKKNGLVLIVAFNKPILKIFPPVLYEQDGVFWQKRECEFLFDEGGSF